MQVLYKDEEGFLAVMEVTKAAYIEDEELMEICGRRKTSQLPSMQNQQKKRSVSCMLTARQI